MKLLLRVLYLSISISLSAWGQFETAAVLGTVRDTSNSVVAGASVTLLNTATGIAVKSETGEDGNYLFTNVKIGSYTITAGKAGFATVSVERVEVRVGARQRVDLTLAVGQVNESVQVSASVAAVESDSSDRGQVLGSHQIAELPLNGRNYSDLALLTTGVRRSAYAFANPPREGAFNVNGQRSVFNNFLMDGVDNNAYGTSNQGFSSQVVQATPDAVAEFKTVTTLPSAEFGRSSGAVINASMKSGTNSLHGSAWEYLRNTELNAVGFFRPTYGKPVFQRNQFGATLGGPVIRNRAFFFADWEGLRERQKFVSPVSIPTLQDRQGIFTVAVQNPLTGGIYPANTPIPASVVTPFAQKVLSQLPNPTGSGRSNNLNTLRADRSNSDKMDLKLDSQINSLMTAFIRLSHRKMNTFQQPEIPAPSGGLGNGNIRALNQQLALGYTYTMSPTRLLEVRTGFSRTRAGKEPLGLGGPSMLDMYGITGLPDDARVRGGLTTQRVTGFSDFGRQSTNPQWQNPFSYNPKVNFSQMFRKHSIKVGYEYLRVHTEVQDVNPLYGLDIYSGQFSRVSGSPTPTTAEATSYNLADFMFGLRSEYQLITLFVAQMRQAMHFGYVQDDWKIGPKLTVNLGLRYEYATPYWEASNRLSNFDPSGATIVQAKGGSIFDRALVDPDRNNFAPRLGVAYSLNPKTVIRSGYGISYIHFNRVGSANLLALNGPQVVSADIIQRPTDATFRTTQDGYPAGLTSPANFNSKLANIAYIPRDTRSGRVQSWSFSVQRELSKNMVLDVAYVGNNSANLVTFADFNQARPNAPGETLSVAARRPYSAYGPITVTWPHAWGNYNALQAKLDRRWAGGLALLNSFVYSKAIDTTGQSLEAQGTGGRCSPQSFYDLASEIGVSDFDQTFNNTTSLVYELPFGKGRKMLQNMPAPAEYALGGWEITAINNMWSGEPLNFSYTPASAFQVSSTLSDWRGGISYRPNVTGPVMASGDTRTITHYFNTANVSAPTDASRPFGNAGRNIARGYGLFQTDFGLAKKFALPREGMTVQFRAEAFNLFNRTNFRFGDASSLNISSANFGKVTSTYPARQLQFTLRFAF